MQIQWGQIWEGNVDFPKFQRLDMISEPYIREKFLEREDIANIKAFNINSVFWSDNSQKQASTPNRNNRSEMREQNTSHSERITSTAEQTNTKPYTPQRTTRYASDSSNTQKNKVYVLNYPKYDNYGNSSNEELRGKNDPHIPSELRKLYDVSEVTPKLFPPDYTFDNDYDTQRLLKQMFKNSGVD
ncbi:hypothetical protein TVAG_475200 [Trichomonas vaginalis G3]|uniref:Uncharacterized protein n=1 Tax=Trichomonas vaginalis (strain ATCC PRA-98 / G3) TaxID=412133 RepID=A2EM27_TRIV3|nr:hypothetical protein TVAGG3_0613490 [Trichomonas vaginalis G3]EAY06286.1 hypothetical protein TVAG_475200 [Trichomonas vaginalis G3]KAI5503364.1 hypothetical protein TVAGG3_0613490 [Trichomonas vaginalis G3]|eukprot:XP_001318509.1 hypothetical protein [Trichomonas vaginalis G3]